MRESVFEATQHQPVTLVQREIEQVHPADDFVTCLNSQVPQPDLFTGLQHDLPQSARIEDRTADFAYISGRRSFSVRWSIVFDTRADQAVVYDARVIDGPAVINSPNRTPWSRSVNAFRTCGADYRGAVPFAPDEWADWFDDPFFDNHERWRRP